MLRAALIGFALVLGLGLSAQAKTAWQVDPARSDVAFEYVKDGDPTEGTFRKFTGKGVFDAAAPEEARFELQIQSSSIDLYDTLASAFATSAEWFDSKNHPDIIYVLRDLKAVGGEKYLAIGSITIRGKEQPLRSELNLVVSGDGATAKGTLTIRRNDFLLGVGPSAAFVEIGPDVQVRFSLVARPDRF